MTDIQEAVKRIESSDVFSRWVKSNSDNFLVHIFCIVKGKKRDMELGYYSKESDKITVFECEGGGVRPPEDVFKEKGELQKLEIENVKIGFGEVREISEDFRKEKYEQHPVQQEICVLQQVDGPVWNITLVLMTLNMLNLKISAVSGKVITSEFRNIMDLRAGNDKK